MTILDFLDDIRDEWHGGSRGEAVAIYFAAILALGVAISIAVLVAYIIMQLYFKVPAILLIIAVTVSVLIWLFMEIVRKDE